MENNKGRKIKFLHCSDIHLDAPYVGLPLDKADERRREGRATFLRMMELAREREIDYILISGDLFDSRFATNTTAELLIREFRNTTAKIIIAPGAHDAYQNSPIYTSERLPENCYVFTNDNLSRFDFADDRLTVYGWAFKNSELTENPIADNRVDDASKINIVVGYADLDGALDSKSCPLSSADLGRFGADYYALGGRHDKTEFVKKDGAMYSYSGSLECTGFDEPYMGGVKLLTIDYNDGELSIDAKHVSFGRIKFVTESVDITGVNGNNEITNRISRLISERRYGTDTALRIDLTGSVDPRFQVPSHVESDAFGLYYFEVIDKTLPTYGAEHFLRDMSVSGEIYRRLLPMLESEREEDRLLAARAFRVGLAALENREIDL